MSRTVLIHCSRCGTSIIANHSILTVTAGELANRVEEPYFDLCAGCTDRFLDWLRGGRQNGQGEEGAAHQNAPTWVNTHHVGAKSGTLIPDASVAW